MSYGWSFFRSSIEELLTHEEQFVKNMAFANRIAQSEDFEKFMKQKKDKMTFEEAQKLMEEKL